jgi:hypothetical protein
VGAPLGWLKKRKKKKEGIFEGIGNAECGMP